MSNPTKQYKTQAMLSKQMDLLADRAEVITERARNNARHLPTGDAKVYAAYIKQLCDRMIAPFEASEPVPRFGAMFDLDGDE